MLPQIGTDLALKDSLVVDWPAHMLFVCHTRPLMLRDSRVDYDIRRVAVDRRTQAAFRRRLERAAVWVLRHVPRLVVDDGLDERRELWVN